MLQKTGVATKDLVSSRFPENEVLKRPKAITECYEDIPCNPCSTVCPFQAITIGEDINKQPVVDFDRCTGCAICVYSCPGLAILTVQIKEDKAIFKIPYEFRPYPNQEDIVEGVNREGTVICSAKIIRVITKEKQDKTALLHVEVPIEFLHEFVTIRRP